MTQWRPAGTVFFGGTAEAQALKGRRVRNRVSLLSSRIYDPIAHSDTKVDVFANSVGFLANPIGDELLIAYSKIAGSSPASLDTLMRSGAFNVIRVNWPTFRMQFDIEG